MDRLTTESLLQFIAPVSWGFGLWLLFLGLNISGTACLSCFGGISAKVIGTPMSILETIVGAVFFFAGMALLVISLGMVSAKTDSSAARWLVWLGRWRPLWQDGERAKDRVDKYRVHVLGLLIAILVGAVLVIPGIGEDRTFVLNRFYDLWGTVFYFYTTILLLASLILIFYRRNGGYVLSLVVGTVAIGLDSLDLLGLLPPAPLTLRTSIIFLANFLIGVPLALISWKSIRHLAG